jgi:hypothetical protein
MLTCQGSGSEPLFRLSAHDKPTCALSFSAAAPGLLATASTDKKAWILAPKRFSKFVKKYEIDQKYLSNNKQYKRRMNRFHVWSFLSDSVHLPACASTVDPSLSPPTGATVLSVVASGEAVGRSNRQAAAGGFAGHAGRGHLYGRVLPRFAVFGGSRCVAVRQEQSGLGASVVWASVCLPVCLSALGAMPNSVIDGPMLDAQLLCASLLNVCSVFNQQGCPKAGFRRLAPSELSLGFRVQWAGSELVKRIFWA